MALRDHVEGRESMIVATMSVVMWVGICWLFGLPTVMVWIVAVLLFLGGVVKSGGSSTSDDGQDTDPATGTGTARALARALTATARRTSTARRTRDATMSG